MERTPALRNTAASLVEQTGHPAVVVLAIHEDGSVEGYAAGNAHPAVLAAAVKAAAQAARQALPEAIATVRQMRQN